MLKMIFNDVEIVRTRDADKLKACDFVVDVGGVFDHQSKRYDHHQAGFNLTMDSLAGEQIKTKEPTKLSSAGLIYWFYGKKVVEKILGDNSKDRIDFTFQNVYHHIIQEIDDLDNNGGGSGTCLSSRVLELRPNWNEDQEFESGFYKAMEMVTEVLVKAVKKHGETEWSARDFLLKKIASDPGVVDRRRKALILDMWVPYAPHLYFLRQRLNGMFINVVVTYDVTSGEWVAKSTNAKNPRGLRFPRKWGGLRDLDLERVCGVKDAKYAHENCHLVVANTKAAVLEMIDLASR